MRLTRHDRGRPLRLFSFQRCLVCIFISAVTVSALFMASFFSSMPIQEGTMFGEGSSGVDAIQHAQCPQKNTLDEDPALQFSKYGMQKKCFQW